MVESESWEVAVCVLRSNSVHFPDVLVSAVIDRVFFPVASIVLSFGFRMRILLVTH